MDRLLKIVKKIAGPLKLGMFRLLVSQAYRQPGKRAHELIRAVGRRWRRAQRNGRRPLWLYEWFMDCTLRAQQDFFRRHPSDPLDLNTAPIGFGGLHIRCTTANANSSNVYLFGSESDQTHFHAYRRFARPGTCAIDVGANLGIHALVLAGCVGDGGKVYAFEPVPSICAKMKENLKLNGVTNVDLHEGALGSSRGEVVFDANAADFNIGKGRVNPHGDITVPITTIDCQLGELTLPVSMVKIDTEGHELEVLKGAAGLLEKHRPTILMEFNPDSYTLLDIRHHTPDRYTGFELPKRAKQAFRPIRSEPHGECELLMVPDEKLRKPLAVPQRSSHQTAPQFVQRENPYQRLS
jgi:FkbM family methyltransferase